MPGIGMMEILIVGVVALLVFGPKRLPEIGRSLGRGMREFKTSVTADERDDGLTAVPELKEDEPATVDRAA